MAGHHHHGIPLRNRGNRLIPVNSTLREYARRVFFVAAMCYIDTMNKYTLLYRVHPLIRRTMKQGFLSEGWTVFFEDEDTLMMTLHREPVDAGTEEKMLRVILSRFRRSSAGTAVLDLTDMMNRHIARLTENQCSSLKLHDPFLDELKQLQVRTLVQN